MNLKIVTLLLAGILGLFILTEQSVAQRPWRARGPLNRHHRLYGLFYSDGYHTATRGPNVNYYNPYSATNTSRYNTSAYDFGGYGYTYPAPTYSAPIYSAPNYHYVPTQPYRQYVPVPPTAPTAPGVKQNQRPQSQPNPPANIKPKVPPQKSPSDDTTTQQYLRNAPVQRVDTQKPYQGNLESVLQIN